MDAGKMGLGCGCCHHTRRSFLKDTCAASGGAVVLTGGLTSGFSLSRAVYGDESPGKMRVRVIFALHAQVQPRADWPHIGFDFQPVMEETMNVLAAGCADMVFLSSMASGPEATKPILDTDATNGNVDGYIVVQMNSWNRVVQDTVETGKPVLFADFLYAGSGGFLVFTAGMLRGAKPNFAHISSSRIDDLVSAARCMPLAKTEGGCKAFVDAVSKMRRERTPSYKEVACLEDPIDVLTTDELLKELRGKRIIEVEKGWFDYGQDIKESLGIEIVRLPFAELNDAWKNANADQAAEVVRRWKNTATEIVGVSDDTLLASAKMYLAQKDCMTRHGACAITINCLGGFYGKHISAYPCLGFHELLNEGLIGACECDSRSTLTMVIMTALTKGRPGYISDPVIDIATRQIIYAHCVASNKQFGQSKAANPFNIMTHSEDRQGASVRSTMPVGYMTTSLEIDPLMKEVLFHQAITVDNSTEDRACRTKLAATPIGDFEKLFTEWDRWGWHRVTYYGDLKKPVFALAEAMGWKVIEDA